jgi:hypothetical protein
VEEFYFPEDVCSSSVLKKLDDSSWPAGSIGLSEDVIDTFLQDTETAVTAARRIWMSYEVLIKNMRHSCVSIHGRNTK